MCGIAGYFNVDGCELDLSLLLAMKDHLHHRGPDGSGHFVDKNIGLAHARLSVIDVSGGAQPMFNQDRSLAVVFNGEIYNFQSLRHELENRYEFTTKSDTEVILHLYEEEGIACVKRFRGMFAFALWDQTQKKLFLARDRMGQKPLYYEFRNKQLLFASEIRALLVGGAEAQLNYRALDLFFKNQFITGPETIFRSIFSLPPAHILTLDKNGIHLESYWRPSMIPDTEMSRRDFSDALKSSLSEAVRLRLISDVPLGAFLSGGLDSTLVVALMRDAGVEKTKSFSIGFDEKSFDESRFAKEAASFYQTEHHSEKMDADVETLLPQIIAHFDQPFGDSSSLAQYKLCEMTRRSVTVALSGDGSDELFAGYRRYVGRKLLKFYWMLPKTIRHRLIEPLVRSLPESTAYYQDDLIKQMKLFCGISNRLEANPLDLLPTTFSPEDLSRLYLPSVAEKIKQGQSEGTEVFLEKAHSLDAVSEMMWADCHAYLPDDILVKVDRMSMAHGLEVRSPFMDQEVVDLAMKMPVNLKLRALQTKYILKQSFSKMIPPSIMHRKKHGFMLPLGTWFKEDLKPLMESVLLKPDAMGLFNTTYIASLLQEHQSGDRDHSQKIWSLLIFFLWEESVMSYVS